MRGSARLADQGRDTQYDIVHIDASQLQDLAAVIQHVSMRFNKLLQRSIVCHK